ncbi:MAG: inositol monophosphatase [Butyrivibrio sp.]|nr:inositol monophosphatase [Butyrivibrio sp.]
MCSEFIASNLYEALSYICSRLDDIKNRPDDQEVVVKNEEKVNALQILSKIEKVVAESGKIILKADRSNNVITSKEGHANFVTKYDKKVQEVLENKLLDILPKARFVGEEGEHNEEKGSGFEFIVDPIDGTTNFIKDYHVSAISVGLVKDGKPYIGVVYNPYLKEMFTAITGIGAWCNGRNIHVSDNELENGIVLFGTSPYYEELNKKSFDTAFSYFKRSLDIRRSGSAALDLCSIAAGRAELYFELILQPWDYAAGALIVTEAGGKVTTFEGGEVTYNKPCSILATNSIAE